MQELSALERWELHDRIAREGFASLVEITGLSQVELVRALRGQAITSDAATRVRRVLFKEVGT